VKIIGTAINIKYARCTIIIDSFYGFRFRSFFCVLCFIKVKLSVKVKLCVLLLCLSNFAWKGHP